jgi:hypothetical protein
MPAMPGRSRAIAESNVATPRRRIVDPRALMIALGKQDQRLRQEGIPAQSLQAGETRSCRNTGDHRVVLDQRDLEILRDVPIRHKPEIDLALADLAGNDLRSSLHDPDADAGMAGEEIADHARQQIARDHRWCTDRDLAAVERADLGELPCRVADLGGDGARMPEKHRALAGQPHALA